MTEAEWLKWLPEFPGQAVRGLYDTRSFPHRKFRLLSCACCWRLLDSFPADSVEILRAAERYSDGHFGESELREMCDRLPVPHDSHLERWPAEEELYDAVIRTAGPPYSYEEWDKIIESDSLPPAEVVMYALSMAASQLGRTPTYDDVLAETGGHRRLAEDIFGNPFRPVAFDSRWRSESAVALARTAYDTRNFTLLPILADALEEAGCDHPDVLTHCREPNGVHVRGCWVVDGVLGKS
jgi:hypothetical protein